GGGIVGRQYATEEDRFTLVLEDHDVPLEETVTALGEEVARGRVGLLGASNHRAWRVERARTLARDQGVAGYEALQLRRSYVSPRPDAPVPDEGHMFTDEDSLDMVASEGLPLWVYSPLLQGAFVRPDRLQEHGVRRRPDHPRAHTHRAARRRGARAPGRRPHRGPHGRPHRGPDRSGRRPDGGPHPGPGRGPDGRRDGAPGRRSPGRHRW